MSTVGFAQDCQKIILMKQSYDFRTNIVKGVPLRICVDPQNREIKGVHLLSLGFEPSDFNTRVASQETGV